VHVKGRDLFGDSGFDERIILKMFLKGGGVCIWTYSIGSQEGTVAGFCELILRDI
jgi:hypothetical protein